MEKAKPTALDLIKQIDDYLQVGGFFNPELMDHNKVRDMLLDCRNEFEEILKILEKQQKIIRRVYVDHFPDTYFVCGESGNKDQNGLPDRIEVCPAYGVDWTQVYERTDIQIGGMGS
jgi:hypothetical protein